jgi:hypothetical protein
MSRAAVRPAPVEWPCAGEHGPRFDTRSSADPARRAG